MRAIPPSSLLRLRVYRLFRLYPSFPLFCFYFRIELSQPIVTTELRIHRIFFLRLHRHIRRVGSVIIHSTRTDNYLKIKMSTKLLYYTILADSENTVHLRISACVVRVAYSVSIHNLFNCH